MTPFQPDNKTAYKEGRGNDNDKKNREYYYLRKIHSQGHNE
jgi:hypothetical protein